MYENDPNMKVRCVDCDKEQMSGLCFEENVNGFPSIYLYKNSVQLREYEADRNLEQLIDFMVSHQTDEGIAAWLEKNRLREIEYEAKQIRKAEAKRLKALYDASSTASP